MLGFSERGAFVRINHLIIGAERASETEAFYQQVLGFKKVDTFIDTGTEREGAVLVFLDNKTELLELLIVPFETHRLPSPQHIALEVSQNLFETIHTRAQEMGLTIRALPPLSSTEFGIGEFTCRGQRFKRFYILDPGRVNIELMLRLT